MQNDATQSLDEVVGRNIRRIRDLQGITADFLAMTLRNHGLDWNRSTVASVEIGRRSISLDEFAILAFVLGVDELLKSDSPIVIGALGGFGRGLEVQRIFGGESFGRLPGLEGPLGQVAESFASEQNEAEQKAARKLGVTPLEVAAISVRLWGRGLTAERERIVEERADPGASARSLQAVRGQVTRQLLAEIESEIEKEG